MRYWWVNQNQTYKHEVSGGFLWSPKTRTDGARNQFYENMRDVRPGDVVFSFSNTLIKAIGIAAGAAVPAPKPDFGSVGGNWSAEGWLVPIEFKELEQTIRPRDYIDVLRPHLPQTYSPLQSNGDGLQNVYLAAVPEGLAAELIKLLGAGYTKALAELWGQVELDDDRENKLEDALKGRTDIGATTKAQLIQARRGQGIFKANVRLNEHRCRVTGIKDPRHLRASHIKGWSKCNDEEKLNGCNGLLLAPHVDHLFDNGFISFSDNGDLLVSPKLNSSVLTAWGIRTPLNAGTFNEEQSSFLAFHRKENGFKK
jgi:putative restriction endonuclease